MASAASLFATCHRLKKQATWTARGVLFEKAKPRRRQSDDQLVKPSTCTAILVSSHFRTCLEKSLVPARHVFRTRLNG